ncbi:D-Ala-D-Ala carboxypeptidase family metallohydrolase [Pararhizobium gei]|uniref:D-Ala-D-Ala carboxypeptidase family metallohydrolase n=1 Tax=Pararhizobium gei TaxID=1395951 RepID=UPI0023DB6622|nr:D-Ala-D-Ala carboxypeptidase family metallohydrolase [Rhizobium gei]
MIRSFGCAAALTLSTLILPGCVSTAKDAAAVTEETVPAVASGDGEQSAPGNYQDQQVAATGNDPQPQGADVGQAMAPAGQNRTGSLPLETNGLNATAGSIFAARPASGGVQPQQSATGGSTDPLPVHQQTGVNPVTNSLFNSGQTGQQPLPLPVDGANNETNAENPVQQTAESGGVSDSIAASKVVAVPPGSSEAKQPAQRAAAGPTGVDVVETAGLSRGAAKARQDNNRDVGEQPKSLAALFAAKRNDDSPFDGDRFAKASKSTIIAKASQKPQKIAALGFTQLPGVQTTSMFATMDDAPTSHDDETDQVRLASLSGLARLAPSGLLLQTEKVETGCFQPELLQLLKVVETHYGRKVMVTSGLRDLKHNIAAGGRRASLHTACKAADIQVQGVSKWELSEYLRTIPGRGGVGTYCHTESVHIDTGAQRDWNWRCRRRQNS